MFDKLNQVENFILSILHSKQLPQDGEAWAIMRSFVDSIEEFKESNAIVCELEFFGRDSSANQASQSIRCA